MGAVAELLLEVGQLGFDGGLAGALLERVALEGRLVDRAAGFGGGAERLAGVAGDAACGRLVAPLGGLVVLLGQPQFIALDEDLPFEQVDPRGGLGGEFLGQRDGLGVADLVRESATAGVVLGLAARLGQFTLGTAERLAQLADSDLEFDQGLPEAGGLVTGGRTGARGEEAVEMSLEVVEVHGLLGVGSGANGTRRDAQRSSNRWGCRFRRLPPHEVSMSHRPVATTALLLVLAACSGGGGGGSVSCGIASLTGPLVAKEAFAKGNSLTAPPDSVPASVPLRIVAGQALRGHVTSADSLGWHLSSPDTIAEGTPVGFGVLLVDRKGETLGALVFEGVSIPGAPVLGDLTLRDTIIPLLGVRVDRRQIEDPKCPLFPDSTR